MENHCHSGIFSALLSVAQHACRWFFLVNFKLSLHKPRKASSLVTCEFYKDQTRWVAFPQLSHNSLHFDQLNMQHVFPPIILKPRTCLAALNFSSCCSTASASFFVTSSFFCRLSYDSTAGETEAAAFCCNNGFQSMHQFTRSGYRSWDEKGCCLMDLSIFMISFSVPLEETVMKLFWKLIGPESEN